MASDSKWPGPAFEKARPKADTRLTARPAATAYRGQSRTGAPGQVLTLPNGGLKVLNFGFLEVQALETEFPLHAELSRSRLVV